MLQLLLYSVIGFCATAGVIGLVYPLAKFLQRPENYYYEKERRDG